LRLTKEKKKENIKQVGSPLASKAEKIELRKRLTDRDTGLNDSSKAN